MVLHCPVGLHDITYHSTIKRAIALGSQEQHHQADALQQPAQHLALPLRIAVCSIENAAGAEAKTGAGAETGAEARAHSRNDSMAAIQQQPLALRGPHQGVTMVSGQAASVSGRMMTEEATEAAATASMHNGRISDTAAAHVTGVTRRTHA